MWLRRLLYGSKGSTRDQSEPVDPAINKGIYYLYLIIGLQIAFVFGLVAVIMLVGRVIATPMWVFLFAFILGISGCIYVYRKAKRQFRKFREALQQVDLSGQNFEISVMGGFLTMRVEQNPRRLLEAPSESIIESKPLESA